MAHAVLMESYDDLLLAVGPENGFTTEIEQSDDPLMPREAPDALLDRQDEQGDLPTEPGTEASLAQGDAETDDLVAQYFGDVRQFALLNRTAEQALWQQIVQWQDRVRRVLYASPIAFATLHQIGRQESGRDRLQEQAIVHEEKPVSDQSELGERLEAAMGYLQDLSTRLQQHLLQHCTGSIQAQRTWRRTYVALWQEWLSACEALELDDTAHDALQTALQRAYETQPSDPALQVSYQAWHRAQHRLEVSKAQMLRANLRLVIHVAKRYRDQGVPFLDLIQEGNVGLMRALEKFEPQRGFKFVTYAHWWVRQAISRAVTEQRRTIRLPEHVVDRKRKLQAATEKLWQVHGRNPTVQELSAELDWKSQQIAELQDGGPVVARLYDPITDDGGLLADVMEDDQTLPPDVQVAHAELQQRVAACLDELPEREALILRLRFGLETDRPHSLKEIGERLGLSRERIRQLEAQSLEQLRQSRHRALLVDWADDSSCEEPLARLQVYER